VLFKWLAEAIEIDTQPPRYKAGEEETRTGIEYLLDVD
jgi:hypothetical protein